ncbi:two-component sensor histidine kinase [Amylibacter ulvae]|uniref:histidine kinase n=1 Tax=Paramylibacter ulvae TaxID=1651968 RepID=A0ABQ3DA78_9RHOB|nr:ATP-binding protein [Amylibacter ulvae]GHA58812.1 two-component sensor histidine kinase [Amylibacter ulvae]
MFHILHRKYLILYAVLAVAIVLATFWFETRSGLNQLAKTGGVRLEQSRDRLLGQLTSFRQLPNVLARHPQIIATVKTRANLPEARSFLLNTSLSTGVEDIYLLDDTGQIIITSNITEPDHYDTAMFHNRADIRAAFNGRLGFFHAIDPIDQSRDFFFARRIDFDGVYGRGVVVVQVDIASLEFDWQIDEDVIAFFDENEVAFVTNRQNVSMRRLSPVTSPLLRAEYYPQSATRPFFDYSVRQKFGHDLWWFDDDSGSASEKLMVSRFVPQIDLTLRVFMKTQNTKAAALLQTQLVAAMLAMIGLGFWALSQRRKRLADRLAIEEAANARLEARVEDRTKQLRETQAQLIQAGKLTALGQMSASISHELNQPMAAIQNFAQNGTKLLKMDRATDAAQNFDHIKGQVDRMSRIIKSLRAFARKEKETIAPVDVQSVIRDTVDLLSQRCDDENVTLHFQSYPSPIMVMGGHVRLQQVFINLLNNAFDAVLDQSDKQVWITINTLPEIVQIIVADSGKGFADETRVFEPFYSTKDVGASKGMGLGLSISYGIIGSFGGELTCQNGANGGAEFCVKLKSAAQGSTP